MSISDGIYHPVGQTFRPYVEAMKDQTLEEFIAAFENALRYFGGVSLVLKPSRPFY